MLLRQVEFYQATLRQAKFYLKKVNALTESYAEQPGPAIQTLRQMLPQLQQVFYWLTEDKNRPDEMLYLLVEFVQANTECTRLIMAPTEWECWLLAALDAAKAVELQAASHDFIIELGSVSFNRGELAATLKYGELSIPIAEALQDDQRMGRSYYQVAGVKHKLGELDVAYELGQKAKEAYQRAGDTFGLGRMTSFMARIAIDEFEYDKAYDLLCENIVRWQETGNERQVAVEQHQIGVMMANRMRYDDAIQYVSSARDIFRKLGERRREAYGLQLLCGIYTQIGQPKIGLENIQRAYDLFQQVQDRRGMAGSLDYFGQSHLALGNIKQAMTYFQQAIELSDDVGYEYHRADSRRLLAESYVKLGEPQKGRQYLVDAVMIAHACGVKMLVLHVMIGLVQLWLAEGENRMAARLHRFICQETDEAGIMEGLAESTAQLKNLFTDSEFDSIAQSVKSLTMDAMLQEICAFYT